MGPQWAQRIRIGTRFYSCHVGYIFAADMKNGEALVLGTKDTSRIGTKLSFHRARIIGDPMWSVSFEWDYQKLSGVIGSLVKPGEPFKLTNGAKIILTEYFSDYQRFDNEGSWVYVIRRDNGDHKIGLTSTLLTRLRAIGLQHGSVELVHAIPCVDRYRAEKFLHEQFSSVRKDGEWFTLKDYMLDEITSYRRFENDFFYTD